MPLKDGTREMDQHCHIRGEGGTRPERIRGGKRTGSLHGKETHDLRQEESGSTVVGTKRAVVATFAAKLANGTRQNGGLARRHWRPITSRSSLRARWLSLNPPDCSRSPHTEAEEEDEVEELVLRSTPTEPRTAKYATCRVLSLHRTSAQIARPRLAAKPLRETTFQRLPDWAMCTQTQHTPLSDGSR